MCVGAGLTEIYTTSKPENQRAKMRWKIFNFFVVIVMSKRLHMDEARNNDGKPDEVKVSRPVWGEE